MVNARMLGLLWWSNGGVMIVYASCLHLLWSIALVIAGPALTHATPIASLLVATREYRLLVLWLLLAAIAAVWGALRGPSRFGFVLMLPQQFLLLIAAAGGVTAILTGTYADGVQRPWAFILTDQLPVILAAPMYTLAVFVFHGIPIGLLSEP